MSKYISTAVRELVRAADEPFCAYCYTSMHNTGQPLTFDHIIPRSKGGQSTFDNLCRACRQCNENKGDVTHTLDPLSDDNMSLFHPRYDVWGEHFRWSADGVEVVGITAIGRATVIALDMNNADILFARKRWVSVGWHPPQ